MMNRKTDCRYKGGYSLVEVSLALLVIAVGIMAAFGLFPEGLNASRKAVDATEISAFAEYVFESLAFDASDPTSDWNTFGSGLSLMQSHALADPGGAQPKVKVSASSDYQEFFWEPNAYVVAGAAVRSYKVTTFTYTLTVNGVPDEAPLKYARLEVWPGSYPQPPVAPGVVFYRMYMPPQ